MVNNRTNKVVFLDLTITLLDAKISCALYEKPLNLHLFLPPQLAHPPGVLFGLIAGMVYQAKSLCTHPLDAQIFIKKFWRHLRLRSYDNKTLRPLFAKAW